MTNENKQLEEPKEIKSPNWIDKNKFKEILAIIDSNKFGHKNKIGDFKYIDIKDLVNNIKDNTISEIDAKKLLNALNEIKKAEIIKYKKRTPGHKKLLNLFNDLSDIILTDKTLESESQENENEKVESRKEENENEVEYKNEDNDDYYEYENKYENKRMNQNKIKNLNDNLDEIIEKSKSFEEQIKLLKQRKNFKGYWPCNDYGDKELRSKFFKHELADMPSETDEKLFEQNLIIHLEN